MKKFIKEIMPPIILKIFKRLKINKYDWKGSYNTWEEAKKVSIGYDSKEILQKVRTSLLKVKNKEAIFERDSVIFDKIQYSWPLLAGLMYACVKSKGKLRVLDFGGSLGSTYFQNKKFLDCFDEVSWSVVEQKHFVDIGKIDFQDDRLKFYYDIETCKKEQSPNVLLLSSVLQYIERPYDLLDKILKDNFEFILLDRTIFSKKYKKDLITIQHTGDIYGNTTIPCWIFYEYNFEKYFSKNFTLIESFDLEDEENEYKYEKGFIWQKK
ncbi:hypothetical protein B9N66_00150 [Campylobacter concisus]|uniref:TIGR04325 family methyltransferase n=1 Tax=Campylobacter concisus TaxID=199 RepID=UPI000B3D6208|nr:TIGR04325 family methyltransferase [Campylobacter concisus]OUT10472.1 hypothetical protein B9N66_00150 [Campylobacter concisus]